MAVVAASGAGAAVAAPGGDVLAALDEPKLKVPRGASAAMLLLREAALRFSRQDQRQAVDATGSQGVLQARAAEWGEFDTGMQRSWSLKGLPQEPSSALSDAAAARGIIISLALLRRRFLKRYELAGIDDLTAMRTAMGNTSSSAQQAHGDEEAKTETGASTGTLTAK